METVQCDLFRKAKLLLTEMDMGQDPADSASSSRPRQYCCSLYIILKYSGVGILYFRRDERIFKHFTSVKTPLIGHPPTFGVKTPLLGHPSTFARNLANRGTMIILELARAAVREARIGMSNRSSSNNCWRQDPAPSSSSLFSKE